MTATDPTEGMESGVLDRLHFQLMGAITLLGDATASVRDADLNRQANIRLIGEIIVEVYAIVEEIYHLEPRLVPADLRNSPYWRTRLR
ncbi:MAG: hypothetical protein ABI559_04145 [Chloroflexota bacterium]